MGCGRITQCASSRHAVHCYDANQDSLAAVHVNCGKLAGKAARKFKISDPDYETDTLKHIRMHAKKATFIEAARSCNVFFEIIFEDSADLLINTKQ